MTMQQAGIDDYRTCTKKKIKEHAFKQAAAFAPEDMPTSNPSSLANLLAMSMASWSVTVTISSICDLSSISGTKPGPIP